MQTWKMSDTLPEQNCLFPDFTRECANYVNFEIATKQRILSANTMFTTFIKESCCPSWHFGSEIV